MKSLQVLQVMLINPVHILVSITVITFFCQFTVKFLLNSTTLAAYDCLEVMFLALFNETKTFIMQKTIMDFNLSF